MQSGFLSRWSMILMFLYRYYTGAIRVKASQIPPFRKWLISTAHNEFHKGKFKSAQSFLSSLRHLYSLSDATPIEKHDPDLLFLEALCAYSAAEYSDATSLLTEILEINQYHSDAAMMFRWIRLTCESRRIRRQRLPSWLDQVARSRITGDFLTCFEAEIECAYLLSIGDIDSAREIMPLIFQRSPTYGVWECEKQVIAGVERGKCIILYKKDALSFGQRWAMENG